MTAVEERAPVVDQALRDRIAAQAAAVDRERAFPRASLEALASSGALGLTVPTEHGGAGGGLTMLAEACETVGGACASTGMTHLMHLVCAATVAGGGGPRAGELLGALARGERIGTLAFSERGTGAHFHAPELAATRDGDGRLRISGRKSFVTSGGHADLYLLLLQGDDGPDCCALDGDAPGLSFDGRWEGLGMAGNASVAMVLDGVTLGARDRIGAPGGGAELVFGIVAPVFLVGLAAVNVGIAAAAQRAAVEHVRGRAYGDGSTLAQVQAIQHTLADAELTTRQARLLVREAAALGDAGDPEALVAIMAAKVAATEAARSVTERALEVCGGQGYTPALPLERHLRDARAGAVMAPTNGVLRSWIGKSLAGLPVP